MAKEKKSKGGKNKAKRSNRLSSDFYKARGLVQRANRRWKEIEANGLDSLAVERAKSESNGKKYFSLAGLDDTEYLQELTRIRTFIADETSTIRGARNFTQMTRNEGFVKAFGRPGDEGSKRYTNVFGEELASRVYASYRRLEEIKQDLIDKDLFPNAYGSENLIIAMFDIANAGGDEFSEGIMLLDEYSHIHDEFQAQLYQDEILIERMYYKMGGLEW